MKTYFLNLSDKQNRNHMVFTDAGFLPAAEALGAAHDFGSGEPAIAKFHSIGRDDFIRAGLKGCHDLVLWLTEWQDAVATIIRKNIRFETDTN
jgi:hypothetical protein